MKTEFEPVNLCSCIGVRVIYIYSTTLLMVGETNKFVAQSAGAVEYTDCNFAEGKDPPHECPRYDTKQSDGEVVIMLELWGMRSTSLLPLLPGPHWPGVVAPDRALSMGYIELTAYLTLN